MGQREGPVRDSGLGHDDRRTGELRLVSPTVREETTQASPGCSRERERVWGSANVRERSEHEGSLWTDGEGPGRAAATANIYWIERRRTGQKKNDK
jgi:hypothetical protein